MNTIEIREKNPELIKRLSSSVADWMEASIVLEYVLEPRNAQEKQKTDSEVVYNLVEEILKSTYEEVDYNDDIVERLEDSITELQTLLKENKND